MTRKQFFAPIRKPVVVGSILLVSAVMSAFLTLINPNDVKAWLGVGANKPPTERQIADGKAMTTHQTNGPSTTHDGGTGGHKGL